MGKEGVRAKNENHRATGLPRDGSTGGLLGMTRGLPHHTQ